MLSRSGFSAIVFDTRWSRPPSKRTAPTGRTHATSRRFEVGTGRGMSGGRHGGRSRGAELLYGRTFDRLDPRGVGKAGGGAAAERPGVERILRCPARGVPDISRGNG